MKKVAQYAFQPNDHKLLNAIHIGHNKFSMRFANTAILDISFVYTLNSTSFLLPMLTIHF